MMTCVSDVKFYNDFFTMHSKPNYEIMKGSEPSRVSSTLSQKICYCWTEQSSVEHDFDAVRSSTHLKKRNFSTKKIYRPANQCVKGSTQGSKTLIIISVLLLVKV